MSTLARALLPELDRPVVLGDYPYYRADPQRWQANLDQLREAGVDVVTCYLPWRLHEQQLNGRLSYDFEGRYNPQHDVRRFLRMAQQAGLAVIVKPGPFIHAEVQLGGLPDRLCGRQVPAPVRGLSGAALTSQGLTLPSLHDPLMRAEVQNWLAQVRRFVLEPFGPASGGPVVGVQIGNEGCYGEVHQPADVQDASPDALAAFERWRDGAPADARTWAQWCGVDVVQHWQWLSEQLPAELVRLVNVPHAQPEGPPRALAGWAARQPAIRNAGMLLGHTEWIGNASRQPAVLAAHCFQQLLNGSDVVEANWGFIWDDSTFAEPATPLFHSLLALLLGSSSCSVYTACATWSWGPSIDLDAAGLAAEGFDPSLYGPPYCPGAPLREDGSDGDTRAGLAVLVEFLARHGADLLRSKLVTHASLHVDPEDCYADPDGAHVHTLLDEFGRRLFRDGVLALPIATDRPARAASAHHAEPGWRATGRRTAVLVRRGTQGLEYVGAFNPSSDDDRVGDDSGCSIRVPGHSAVLVIRRDGRLTEIVAALASGGTAEVSSSTEGEALLIGEGCSMLAVPSVLAGRA